MHGNKFYLKVDVFKNSPKVSEYLGYFVRKLITENFQTLPDLGPVL